LQNPPALSSPDAACFGRASGARSASGRVHYNGGMSRDAVESRPILQVRGAASRTLDDWVVVEEPLEIRVGGDPLAVIMRTPGHDLELAAGFAVTEGLARSIAEIGTIRHCEPAEGEEPGGTNVVEIGLVPGTTFDRERLRRSLMASAACGLCGKASIEALATQARPIPPGMRVDRAVLSSLPDRLGGAQSAFRRTGALHAAGLFDADGSLLVVREDVGRHNAVDKAIGRALMDGTPLSRAILLVSGRTSFEILQKSAVAGIPVVCAISGPTTLAIETAAAFNITLVNFLRDGGMNVASCPERLTGL
jgi:FdhD protein